MSATEILRATPPAANRLRLTKDTIIHGRALVADIYGDTWWVDADKQTVKKVRADDSEAAQPPSAPQARLEGKGGE